VIGHSPPGDLERDLFALPTRIGGMGIINPIKICAFEFSASNKLTKPLQSILLSQSGVFTGDIGGDYQKKTLLHEILCNFFQESQSIGRSLSQFKKIWLLKKDTSNWLTVLPLQEHSFSLHKIAFHDAVALQYGWDPVRLPQHCIFGTRFSVEHSFTCPKGGFPSICHNKIRDLTASLLTEICNEVEVEPPICNQSLVSNLLWPLQTPKMEHVLAFQQMVFEVVGVKRLLLM